METPAALFMVIYYLHYAPDNWISLILLGLWEWHYLYRAYLYPWTIRSARPVPLLIVLFGIMFNGGNTFFNGLGIFALAPHNDSWLTDPRLILGTLLFTGGTIINRMADSQLRGLRKAGTCQIPDGALYRWISCPNYLGEILIWCGWCRKKRARPSRWIRCAS